MRIVSDLIFADGDWSFAESSTRPWAKWPADSDEGKMMLNYYKRYRETLVLLHQEGHPARLAFKAVTDYLEDAMDSFIPKYRIMIADGVDWLACEDGPWETLEGAKQYADAEIGKPWVILQGEKPLLIGSIWTR